MSERREPLPGGADRRILDRLASRLRQGRRGSLVLLGCASDAGSSFTRGAAEAPAKIRTVLYSAAGNLWAEDGTHLESTWLDVGDVTDSFEAVVSCVIDHDRRPLILGGDHAITLPAVRALASRHGRLDLLQFDAHPDLYDAFDGRRDSHASTFARIVESGVVERLVQVGVRAATGDQREQARRFGVQVVAAEALPAEPRWDFERPFYLSLDVDVLDPAFAPGVSHREPGGLSVRQLLAAIRGARGTLVGADIVEYNPRHDVGDLTAGVGAKLVKEIAARMIRA